MLGRGRTTSPPPMSQWSFRPPQSQGVRLRMDSAFVKFRQSRQNGDGLLTMIKRAIRRKGWPAKRKLPGRGSTDGLRAKQHRSRKHLGDFRPNCKPQITRRFKPFAQVRFTDRRQRGFVADTVGCLDASEPQLEILKRTPSRRSEQASRSGRKGCGGSAHATARCASVNVEGHGRETTGPLLAWVVALLPENPGFIKGHGLRREG